MPEAKEFQQRIQRIEELVRKIEALSDPELRANAQELLQTLMELHGAGIERMLEMIAETGPPGMAVIDNLAGDDLVASLLLLYGLHPLDLESRVMQALDKVRPYLQSHGGNVELLGVAEGVVRLRLQGSCNGCASSAQTLKLAIEDAIYDAAPDLAALEVEGVVEQPSSSGLVQLGRLPKSNGASQPNGNGSEWESVSGLEALEQSAARIIEVSGHPVLFCRLDETLYAYSHLCAGCGQTLQGARIEAAALVCPTCGQRYDVARAGRAPDQPSLHLEPFPLLVEEGRAKIARPVLSH